jgi:hypothetical protein
LVEVRSGLLAATQCLLDYLLDRKLRIPSPVEL